MSETAGFKSDAFEAIHSSASAMLKVGTIDKATMRRFNENCLAVPVVAPCENMVESLQRDNHPLITFPPVTLRRFLGE